ncbi:hypothetical protein COO60DRAFT_1491074, partial [Scenedesmus sp. NREL 46B-D3]
DGITSTVFYRYTVAQYTVYPLIPSFCLCKRAPQGVFRPDTPFPCTPLPSFVEPWPHSTNGVSVCPNPAFSASDPAVLWQIFLDDPDEHVVEGQLTTDELVCAAVPQLGAALRSAVQSPALQAQAAATGVTVPEGDADDVEPAKAMTLQEAQQALAVLQTFMRDAPVTAVSPAMRTSASSIDDALNRMRIDRARQGSIFSYVARTG